MTPEPTDDQVDYSERFRKVSNRYPLRVTEAYAGDLKRAMDDSDEQVATTVASWERSQGLEPRDWPAIGKAERAALTDAEQGTLLNREGLDWQ